MTRSSLKTQTATSGPGIAVSILLGLVFGGIYGVYQYFSRSKSNSTENNADGEQQPSQSQPQDAAAKESKSNPTENNAVGEQQRSQSQPPANISTKRRKKSQRHDDDSSSTIEPNESHNISRHILARLRRWFRFGGLIQRISNDTNIRRSSIVEAAASAYQDRRSGLGHLGFHAAHLVRAGTINGSIERLCPQHFNGLRDFIGHTENVHRSANVGGVGRDIDEFQTNSNFLTGLHSINFSCEQLSPDDASTIQTLLSEYVKMLRTCANGTSDVTLLDNILSAITQIEDLQVSDYFEAGRKGFKGDYESWKKEDGDRQGRE